jgi:hypothetical protein
VIVIAIRLPRRPTDLVICTGCNCALTSNKLKSGNYLVLAATGKGKKKKKQERERDRRTWFIRKFHIAETPANFSLEVRFTAKMLAELCLSRNC